jgi:pimeloyl-ACP methyl ester carboxylesterase
MSARYAPAGELRSIAGAEIELFQGGQGQPVLVLHDYEYLHGWHPFLEALAEWFAVTAPSHPGFGRSELPAGCDSIEDLAYWYADLLPTLGGERVHLVGLGLGGWIAAELATRCTHQIDRLVLVDAVGIKVSGPHERDIADTFIVEPRELVELTWHDPAAGAAQMKLPGLSSLSEEDLLLALRNRQSAAFFGWKPFMHNPKLAQRLRRIDRPTLVLWGASDRLVSPAYGRAYAELIPGARFEQIESAGHYPYLERPEAFVKTISRFLVPSPESRVPSGPATRDSGLGTRDSALEA